MHNPWSDELAIVRQLEEELGDQRGHGRWLYWLMPIAVLFYGGIACWAIWG